MTSTARKELKAKGFRVIQGEVGQEDLMEKYIAAKRVYRSRISSTRMSWREHRLLTTRIQILRAKCSCRVRDAPK